MTEVCVILPPNFRQVWGYAHISGQNKYFVPILLLVTSHFMFWTYRSLKKLLWVSSGGRGCTVTNSGPWTTINMFTLTASGSTLVVTILRL